MSSIKNLHPPQTYSRLFRPWDTNKANQNCSDMKAMEALIVKAEWCSSMSSTAIKSEHRTSSTNDRECNSSGSSSKCTTTSEDSLPSDVTNQNLRSYLPTNESPEAVTTPLGGSPLYGAYEPHSQLQIMSSMSPTSELYYAAAAAAAATAAAVNGIIPTSHVATPFGTDPYTLGLMEQEYARVMAEDAHLKAISARKQRPKKFKCPHCEVAFSNNGQLKGHIRIHTGERPFKCDVETCGKTFTRNEELTRHKRIHTGLRPYPCSACGKKFGRRDHLKKHMKTHMPQDRQLGPAIFVPMYPYLYGY